MIRFPSPHVFSAAGGISLAALVAFTGIATAAPLPAFSYTLSADTLKASVVGDVRTGVWRIRLVNPAGDRRVDFILRSSDITWSGTVRVSGKFGNSWSLIKTRSLDEALAGGAPMYGCNAGVCWDTTQFRLPRNGDARFGVTVRLTRSGDYRLSGAVREASDAFIFGSWLRSASAVVTH